MKDPLKKYIQDHHKEFDTNEAPSEMFDKIMSKLDNSTPSVGKTRSIVSWKTWTIAASITIILSLGIFNLWTEKEIDETVFATKQTPEEENKNLVETSILKKDLGTSIIENKIQKKIATGLVNNRSDYQKKSIENQNYIPNNNNNNIENENHSNKANAIELMNNQFSASSRLKGIASIKSFSDYDSKIIDLLSEKAISDENTNVRLAAVSALEAQKLHPAVTNRIQQIFVQQNDPMVQKELISFLAEKQSSELSPEVNTKLLTLAQDPTTVDFVKDEAYAVLMKY